MLATSSKSGKKYFAIIVEETVQHLLQISTRVRRAADQV